MEDHTSEQRGIVRGIGWVIRSRRGLCQFLTPVFSSFFVFFGYLSFSSDASARAASSPLPATGPLRVHPENPRYFADGKLAVEWMHPITGQVARADPVEGGAQREFTAPFAGDAVLYVRVAR